VPLINTAGDLIAFCLRMSGVNGVGQTPIAMDSNDGLQVLSNIVAQWQRRRWLVWALADASIISSGAQSYTIGTGGDFNVPRPDRIDSAFARLLFTQTLQGPLTSNGGVVMVPTGSTLPTSPPASPGAYWNNGGVLMVTPGGVTPSVGNLFLDFPLAIVPSREDYNKIVLKGLTTFPGALFYESSWPLGVLHFWPIPNATQWELHVTAKVALPTFDALSDPINMPPEYMAALTYQLAVELSMLYGIDPRPSLVALMNTALNTIRMANTQIATLAMPGGLGGRTGSGGAAASASQGFMGGWMV
jgi:hypothetical protein